MAQLCTQQDVERVAGVLFDNNPESYVTEWITAASRVIEKWTRRSFNSVTAYTETVTGQPRNANVYLTYYPVTAINSITEDGTVLTEGTDFIWEDNGIVTRTWDGLMTRAWDTTWDGIVIDYDGGEIPPDITDVCAGMVARAFAKNLRFVEQEGIASESIEQYKVAYLTTESGRDGYTHAAGVPSLTGDDKAILSPYRKRL